MIVKCIKQPPFKDYKFEITIGKEYNVIINYMEEEIKEPYYEIIDDINENWAYHSKYFVIVDNYVRFSERYGLRVNRSTDNITMHQPHDKTDERLP